MQHQSTATLVRATLLPCCSVLLCNTGSPQAGATVITLTEICTSYKCVVMQHQSTAKPVRARTASLLLCAALQNRLTASLCHCLHTDGDLHFIQECRDSTPEHCNTCQGNTASLLFCAALQNRLTASLCHCHHTDVDLQFIQV